MPIGARLAAAAAATAAEATPAKIWRGPPSSLRVTPTTKAPPIRISRLSHSLSHQPHIRQLQRTGHSLPHSTYLRSCSSSLAAYSISFPPTTALTVWRSHTTKSTSTKMAAPREWTAQEVRDTFLKFFEERGHTFGESVPFHHDCCSYAASSEANTSILCGLISL